MTEQGAELTVADLALCAHDLRGILTVIAGYASLLRRDDLSATSRETALDGIEAAIARADALLGDTLAGRVDSRRKRERVALGEIAARAVADARVATGRDVTLTRVADPSVHADPVALSRVLENLLSNAAKYAPEGPIEVTVSSEDAIGVLEVADRGPGVPPADREAVFEPFVRLERDADKPGTGLGLVVVRNAVEGMGGRVRLLDREGAGTVVRIEIPSWTG